MTKKERFEKIIDFFKETNPEAKTELQYFDAYELLVAVILSAQCTDKRVNMITPKFFEQFPTAEVLANSNPEAVYEIIKSCSYPNSKSRNLVGMAKVLFRDFGGIVPDQVEELVKMPGVGRKTANVVASVVFNKPAMAVDTHVFRVSERIGLTTKAKNPFEAEKQLVKYIPEDLVAKAHHWLILHGRYVCKARKPKCDECQISQYCAFYEKSIKSGSKQR